MYMYMYMYMYNCMCVHLYLYVYNNITQYIVSSYTMEFFRHRPHMI